MFPVVVLRSISRLSFTELKQRRKRDVLKAMSSIQDGAFCENSQRLKAVNYFRKTLHLKCLIGF